MSLFGFGASADIRIELKNEDKLKRVTVKNELGQSEELVLLTGNEDIFGTVVVDVTKNKVVDHLGVKIELIGLIEYTYDKSSPYEFLSLTRELDSQPGQLSDSRRYPFEFVGVEKQWDTYSGSYIKLRYFLRVKIVRQYASNIVFVRDFSVQNVSPDPEVNAPIKMEVGIEDCLHIEFEYNKSKYHLTDVVIGKIYFLLVRIKIKHMEIVIIKRESTGTGPNQCNENENLAKFEIMDGAPVRAESIPLRLFLAPYDLTPTFKNVHNRFSVKYYLNLVLVDEEDRRYFKQQEIQLYRKSIRSGSLLSTPSLSTSSSSLSSSSSSSTSSSSSSTSTNSTDANSDTSTPAAASGPGPKETPTSPGKSVSK